MKNVPNYYIKGSRLKLQRLQDQKQIDGENLNEVRRETSRHFGCKIEDISEGHG
jgi:hypothetical protein